MLHQSNQRTKYSKRKNYWKNKRKQLLPRQKLERKEWYWWIKLEHKKLSQLNGKLVRKTRLIAFSLRHRRRWTRKWMMLNTWTKWSSTQKLLPLETSNAKSQRDSSKSGLMNKRSLILWWKSRDSRSSRKKRKEMLESMMPEREVLRLLLIKSKKEPFKEWKNKKLEIRKEWNSLVTSKEWNKRIMWWLRKRSKELMISWNKLLKLTPNL